MSVYLLATLDTKGPETEFVRNRLEALGVRVTVVDTGCLGSATVSAEVSREEIFQAAETSLETVRGHADRGAAVSAAARGAASIVQAAQSAGQLDGVMALGGSAGTTIGTTAMRALPIGIPKLMVSTLASGQVRPYVGDKDILMLNSVVDIAGINRISRVVLSEAAAAMAGLVLHRRSESTDDKPLIAASMFGVTTPCVEKAREILEQAGYEVLVFHATGNGGQAMESLIDDGLIAGVLDVTTTELADELFGGVLSAGPDRLTAAARHGIPQVVSVGATDMVNFGPRDSVPERLDQRKFHIHNPTVTLMRTTLDENSRLGALIGQKVSVAPRTTKVMLPRLGVSAIDCDGESFEDSEARGALFRAIRENAGAVECIEVDAHINDEVFATAMADKLLQLVSARA